MHGKYKKIRKSRDFRIIFLNYLLLRVRCSQTLPTSSAL